MKQVFVFISLVGSRFKQFYSKSIQVDGLTDCFNKSKNVLKKLINFQFFFANLTFFV